VPPGDVEGLAKSMAFLLRTPQARQSLGMAAARRARENFDVSTMVQAYEELYENLVNHPNRLKAETVLGRQGVPLRQV
jgi:glycosyltransferase involved in cell wall biosynthesis